MRFTRSGKNKNIEIPTTSVTDIIFLIVLFLMVSATFVSYNINTLNMNLPKAKGEAPTEQKNISIAVNKEGQISIDNTLVESDVLLQKLTETKATAPDASIIIQADKDAKHGSVVFVMDQAKKAGFEKMAIAAEEE